VLTKLTATSLSNWTTEALELHMDSSIVLDRIQVRDISGLDPVKAAVNTTQYSDIDGAYYTGATIPDRNIVVTVGYNPDWVEDTIENLRLLLYQYFMPKQSVSLQFDSTHLPSVSIEGVVESITPNIFAQDPEVAISIICPDPAFVAIAPVVLNDTTDEWPHIGFDPRIHPINYVGSIEVPIHLVISKGLGADFTGTIHILNTTAETEQTDLTVLIDSTHSIVFDTTDGARDISEVAGGVETSLMWQTTADTAWIKLKPGLNNFMVRTTSGGQAWQMTYTPKFGGL
jgi:hypothetical protein